MSLVLADKQPLDLGQLNQDIAAFGLPGFVGCARLTRDDQGNRVTPYILVKIGVLSASEEQDVRTTVGSHVPVAPPPTRREQLREQLAADTITFDNLKQLPQLERGL